MWANYYYLAGFTHAVIHPTRAQALAGSAKGVPPVRVAVIPLDDVEAIVERAVTALTAAGIPCKKRKARK
jgi:hypothetical protein